MIRKTGDGCGPENRAFGFEWSHLIPTDLWQRYPHMSSKSSALRTGWSSTVNTPRVKGATCARSLATDLWSNWEGSGLGLGS